MSHTYATMEISRDAYEEISNLLAQAGYAQAFVALKTDDGRTLIALDMHGIALVPALQPEEVEAE
jgi:hypothetical protein